MAKACPPRHSRPASKSVTINLDPSDVKVVQDETVERKEAEDIGANEVLNDAGDTLRPQTADDFSSTEADARLSSEERDSLTSTQDEAVRESPLQAGEKPVDPRLPLADCPRQLQVQPRVTWSPGCDWIQRGYQLADTPQPAPVPQTPARYAPGRHTAAA